MNYLCRLCSSVEKLSDVYHPLLESGDQLRHFILLASGIKILWNDPISRMVCHNCCAIAIKFNKYRSNAIANDKSLKEKYGQPYTPPITDKDELVSAASRIFNLHDVSIIKDDTDLLELLNVLIESRARNLTKINGKSNLNNQKIVNQVKVSNESNIILKDTVTTHPKVLTVGRTHVVHPENGVTHLHNVICSVSEDKQSPIPNDKSSNEGNERVSKQLLLSGLTQNIPKTITPRSALTNNHNEVDNVKDYEESVKIISTKNDSAQTSFASPFDIYTHPSVKKLQQEYNSIQLPNEVYSCDVSPTISLDHNEISDWYAQQLQILNDKLKNVSTGNPLSSSEDEEHFPSRPRRRKRKYKRVINSSDSDDDDDEEWLPFKMQAQDVKSMKPSRLAINPSSAVAPNTVATAQNHIPVGYTSYAVVNGANLAPQPGSSGIKLKIMKYSPVPAATNTTTDKFLATQPNTRVLQSLLTSNDQTLANLYTDFSKYGINIENSEPPIQYENVMDPVGIANSLTDMVLEAMVLQKPVESSQNPAEPSRNPVEPSQNPAEPSQNPTEPTQKPVEPTQKPVVPTQKSVLLTKQSVQLTKKPVQPTQKSVLLTKQSVELTKKPVQPTQKSVLLTKQSVLLTKKPVQPTQKSVLLTKQSVQLTQKPVQPTQKSVLLTQRPPEASIIQDKINDEIICISDDDNDNIGKSSVDSYNFMNSNEDEMVQLLFKKHLSKKVHKDSQTFHPTDAIIHRTKTNLIALPNMVGELKRYKIPIDLQFSATNVAHFENNVRHGLNPTMDKWLREECVDISNLPTITPTVPNKNFGLPNVIKNKPILPTLWHQTFVERLNNTMNNKGSTLPSMPTIVKCTTVPITTLQSNVTYQTSSNIILTSSATCDKNDIPDTVSNMNDGSTQNTKPLVLNGANSLSLRSLLFPTKNTIGKPQEPTSPAAPNIFVNSPLLHNYLQTNKPTTPTDVAVLSSANEQLPKKSDDMSPIVIDDTEDTVRKSNVPSKIRVKSLAELLQKV